MSNAGAVVGAIAAHTVITSTIRNQEQDMPARSPLTETERTAVAEDFAAGLVKQATWAFGGLIALMAVIAGLVFIFG